MTAHTLDKPPQKTYLDALNGADLSKLTIAEKVDYLAKLKADFGELNAKKAPTVLQMDRKLLVLKLWRQLMELYSNEAQPRVKPKAEPQSTPKAAPPIPVEAEPAPVIIVDEKPAEGAPRKKKAAEALAIPLEEKPEPAPVKKPVEKAPPRSATEQASEIDPNNKFVPIQLSVACTVRNVPMPAGLFVVVGGVEARELVASGKAKLLNQ